MQKPCLVAPVTALIVVATATAASADPSLRLSSGVDFSTGDFDSPTDTEILTAPFRAAVSWGDLEISAAASWLHVKGAGNVIPGGAGPIVTARCERIRDARPDLFDRVCRDRLNPDPVSETFSNSGFGDVSLGALWSLPESLTGDWLVDIGARVKIPTASESKSLGTGEVDYSASLDIARGFGPVTLYAGAGFRSLGDPTLPDGAGGNGDRIIILRDGATANAGLVYTFDSDVSLSLGYDYLARTIAEASATQEATLGLSLPLGDGGWRWSGYGVAGLSRSSADFAAGFSLSYSFTR